MLEIKAVLDQRSARVSVVADAVAADPGIEEGQRKEKEEEEPTLEFVRTGLTRRACAMILH